MKLISLAAVLSIAAGVACAGSHSGAPGQGTDTNWGTLTKNAIADGFEQGAHSSDPSGDGHGPGTADEPRVGLANVVERGNLGATTDLIDNLLNP